MRISLFFKRTVIPDGYGIKSVTISQEPSGKYYAAILTEYEVEPVDVPVETALGLDYSSPHFYVDSEGNTADMPHFYRKEDGHDRQVVSFYQDLPILWKCEPRYCVGSKRMGLPVLRQASTPRL